MTRHTRWSSPLAALSILILAAGCGAEGGGEEGGADGGEVERGGTVVIGELSDMSHPIDVLGTTSLDGSLGSDVMNMQLLRGGWRDGRLVFMTADESPMALARSYELVGPDSASLRFHLRSDVRWSDGTPVTARDVVFTYDLVRNPEVASPRQDYVENMDSVVADNDSTVTFHFSHRYPEMRFHAGLSPVPSHVFEGVDPAQIRNSGPLADPSGGKLPVSGPYMVGEWRRGQSITLVRNPHFQPSGNLDQIVFRIIPETATRLVELQTGGLDWVGGIPFDQIPTLRAQAPQIRFEREEKRFYDYIAYNPSGFPAFGDPEIRRALSQAINAPGIIDALQMEEYAVPAGGPYAPIFADLYDPQGQAPVPHDPERARQVLESKGWRDTNGDGIREDAQGRPFRFTLITNAGNQRRADAVLIVQQQLRQVGVDVQLQQRESNTFFDDLEKGEFEAALAGWSVALSPDLTSIFGSDSPFNFTDYRNPQVSALFDRALRQPTEEAAAPLWRQAASIIARDQPYTFLYFMDSVNGINERVRNTRVDTFGHYQNAWEWWVRGGSQQQQVTTN